MNLRKFAKAATVAASLICALPAFALSGSQHQKEIIECLFGPEYLQDQGAKELVDYISRGMDYGSGAKPIDLTKSGSSFLNTVRQKFPNFKATHREFGHWAFDGDIPKEAIQEFEKAYPGQSDEFKELWRKFVRTRREGTRLSMGLSKEADRFAQSITSLAGSCHDLGDWTTPNPEGLPPQKTIIRNIENSYHRILGNNNKAVSEFIDELKAIPETLPPSERAKRITEVWKRNAKLHESVMNASKRYGFTKFKPIDFIEVNRFENALAKTAGVSKTAPRVNLGRAVTAAEKGAAKAATKGAATAATRAAERTAAKGAATAATRAAERTAAKGAAKAATKAAGRGVLSYVGTIAPIVVDLGFWMYGEYKIQDEFTKGRISESERVEKKVVNTGRAVGGAAGGVAGAAIGTAINNQRQQNGGEGGGLAGLLIVAAATIIGGIIGDHVGGETTKTVYEWVERSPYAICCDASKIGDVDAMFFMGLYNHEGRYVTRNPTAAKDWFFAAAREGDVRAQFYYGQSCYSNDPERAFFWWNLAANSPRTESKYKELKNAAAYNVASCFMSGTGVEQNEASGIAYLIKAKQLGSWQAKAELEKLIAECMAEASKLDPDPGALKILGNYYACLGGDENAKKSFDYTYRAARLGNLYAINNLAVCYKNGDGVEKNLSRALSLFHYAADQGLPIAVDNFISTINEHSMLEEYIDWLVEKSNDGYPSACYRLAELSIVASDNASIRDLPPFKGLQDEDLLNMVWKLFERAEAMGSDEAKIILAKIAENNDLRKFLAEPDAETYRRRLVDPSFRNNVSAQLMAGHSYKNGTIVAKNDGQAATFFALAALNGNAEAQCEFGDCCYFGKGVPKNYGKAAQWFMQSAKQGYPYAEFNIGYCYAHGQGVKQNTYTARYWLEKALKDGYQSAREELNKL